MILKFPNKKRGNNHNFVYKLQKKNIIHLKHENKSLISTIII